MVVYILFFMLMCCQHSTPLSHIIQIMQENGPNLLQHYYCIEIQVM